jgi:hypothetical protein
LNQELDLERVIHDPDYRRKAIEDLNRAEARPDGEKVATQQSKTASPGDSDRDDA